MPGNIPRRLPLTPEERLKIIVNSVATGSAEGSTRKAQAVAQSRSSGAGGYASAAASIISAPPTSPISPVTIPSIIDSVQTAANGSARIYRQSTAPVNATGIFLKDGDLWYDTTLDTSVVPNVPKNTLYQYVTGSGWLLAQDAVLARADRNAVAAQVTADGKNRTFVQGTTPVYIAPAVAVVGDTWIDTTNSNRIFTWSGSTWTLKQFGTNAISDVGATLITGQIIAGQIAAGAITAGKIAANAITANEIAANTITSAMINTSGINAAKIVTGTLTGITISGVTITGTTFQNRTDGQGVKILTSGIYINMSTLNTSDTNGGSYNCMNILQNTLARTQSSGLASPILILESGTTYVHEFFALGGIRLTDPTGASNSDFTQPASVSGADFMYPRGYHMLGSTGRDCYISPAGTLFAFSSMRSLKKNIVPLGEGQPLLDSERLLSLPVRQFRWKNDDGREWPIPGFIADEVLSAYPAAAVMHSHKQEAVSWDGRAMTAATLDLVQRLWKRIDELEAQVNGTE